jgi:hypothetical protein
VIDSNGEESDAIDIIVYDRHDTPIIYNQQGYPDIPAESVYAVFESKKELDKELIEYPATHAALKREVARSHRVDDQEFYQLLDKDGSTDDIHLFKREAAEKEDYYNYHRPHGALDGQTPYERLVAKMRTGTSPTS